MLEVDGHTITVGDRLFKQPRDHRIEHEPTRIAIRERIQARLQLEVWKSFQFSATQLER